MTTSLVGSYVLNTDFGAATPDAACTKWSSGTYFSRTAMGRRQYYGPGEIPSGMTGDLSADLAAGRRVTMSLKPSVVTNSSSPSAQNKADKAALNTFLSACKSAGLLATVAIWHEPKPQKLTLSQYANTIRYYQATVRNYYWLACCQAGYAIAHGAIDVGDYFGACDAGSFDLIAGDIYCYSWNFDSTILAKFQTLADTNGLPLALWEFNGCTGTSVTGHQTQTQVTNFFNAVKALFAARITAKKPCGDVLLFDHADGSPNSEFVAPGDFRVALMQQIYDAVNATAAGVSIDTSSLPDAAQGTAYSQALAASGGTSPYTWSITSGSLPAGLTRTAAVISGTPTAGGTSPFTVKVTDSASNTASKALSITVGSNLAITTASLPGATEGTAYSTALAASGGTSPYTWTAGGAFPAGLSISTSGVISGTPTVAGSFNVRVNVTDSAAATAARAFTLTLAPTSSSLGVPYTVTSGGGTGSTSYTFTLTHAVAAGDTIAAAALVSSGSVTSVTDSAGNTYAARTSDNAQIPVYGFVCAGAAAMTTSSTMTVTVSSSAATLALIARGCSGAGVVDQVPAATSNAASGSPSIASGALAHAAEWAVAILASGNGGGTPSSWTGGFTAQPSQHTGSTAFLTVADQVTASTTALAAGATVTSTKWDMLLLTLGTAMTGPTITTATLPGGGEGTAYAASLAASGGTPPYLWGLAGGSLPAGLSLSTGGVITGTPTAGGTSTFTVQATDSASAADTQILSLTVGSNLQITTPGPPPATVSVPYQAQLQAAGGTAPYTWAVTSGSLPPGMSLSSTGVLSGTPTALGGFVAAVTVTDASGQSAVA